MENKESSKIKSFIYLDEDKMYSISSQLFEGMTQYILQEETEGQNDVNSQKGNFLSGRFMADMMFQSRSKSEMRNLHDFAFNLFEKELEDRGILYDVKCNDNISNLQDKGFVRIRGKIIFCDYSRMQYIIDNFNNIGRALGRLQGEAFYKQIEELKQNASETRDREKRYRQQQTVKYGEKQIEELLKNAGLVLDEKYVKNLSTVMRFGYQDGFEARIILENSPLLFSAVINLQCLKENENVLISKYSRITEKEFTVIGVITQVGNPKPKMPITEGADMKTATQGMHEMIANLEMQFNGRSSNECIIDPIAIFTEL